jgi:predicted ATPase
VAGVPSGTVTFLFTDVEESTRRWQDDPEAMRASMVEHDAMLREVVAKHRGHVFKHTGDGIAAVFASAVDACAAAVDAQSRLGDLLPVRMGLHTGEAEARDGDYFGSTLNRCARLMGVAHGGQALVSAAVAALVREEATLVDLGAHRLRDLSYPEHVWQLGAGSFPPLRSLEHLPTNLPLQTSSFVGRANEVTEVGSLLRDQRLVTLTGVGGVGKTRLALEVGANVLPHYVDGVWFVELAPLAHDEMVLATIGDVLGIRAQTGEPFATTLVSRLEPKRLLVILDNCEHVIAPVARLVQRVVSGAPDVRVLATSREPLGIGAEKVRAVPPLAESTEAIELFVERATLAGASVEDSQLDAVGDICARLDGIPLAIELAAARARMMAPAQIAERLDQRFRLLTGGGRTAVERHRTLQATVSWSYGLLDETEQAVFRCLSTMAGTFDLDAAEAVASGPMVDDFEVLDALGHLVDKSMILTVQTPRGLRYRLLETLRQFAAERLVDCGDAAAVQERHAGYFADRAVRLGRSTGDTDQNDVLDAIDVDLDNYRKAFVHLLSIGMTDEAARGIVALGTYWQVRRTREGLRWQETILARADLAPQRRIRALAHAARAEAQVGAVDRAEEMAKEVVALSEAAGVDPPWGALEALTVVALQRGDAVGYRRWWERAHQVAMNRGDQYLLLLIRAQCGSVPRGWPDDDMVEYHERLRQEIGQHGDPMLMFLAANTFATVLHHAGQVDRAREVARASIEPACRAGPLSHSAALITAAAIDALSAPSDVRARAAATEGLLIARDEGLTLEVLHLVFVAAALSVERHVEVAAALLAAVNRHGDATGTRARGDYVLVACQAKAQAAIDAYTGDLTSARRQGEAMSIDELISFTLDALA